MGVARLVPPHRPRVHGRNSAGNPIRRKLAAPRSNGTRFQSQDIERHAQLGRAFRGAKGCRALDWCQPLSRNIGKEACVRPARTRFGRVRSDFTQGHERKRALQQSRMRHSQISTFRGEPVPPKHVQIQNPRPPAPPANTSQTPFDSEQSLHERRARALVLDQNCRVHEVRLTQVAMRGTTEDPRMGAHQGERRDPLRRSAQSVEGGSQVGP